MSEQVTIFDHPLITHKISILRDERTGSKQFRELIEEIAMLRGYDALRDLPTEYVEIKTPITTTKAKMIAAETAMKVTTDAVQMLGGNGFMKEYHVERLMRDAKITQIYEGTTEIQKIVLSKQLFV